MSQNPCKSVHVVIFSPLANSQSSTSPLNCLKRSFINSLAWPTAVRIWSLTEQTGFCEGMSFQPQLGNTHTGVNANSLSSGMDSSSTLASQWTHRLVSLFVSPAISALKYGTSCWDSVVQAGVGGASTGGEHWGVLGCGGSFGTSWGSKSNTGAGGRLKLRLWNKATARVIILKNKQAKQLYAALTIWSKATKHKPGCKEGICWSRGERFKFIRCQASRSLKDEIFWSKRCSFSSILSRDRVSLTLVHHTGIRLRRGQWAGWAWSFLRLLHKKANWL